MKILLVAPRTPDTFWSFRHALRFVSKRAASPPLGLLTVAGMLPRRWQLKLVDLNVQKLRDRDLRWADYVFVSAMVVHADSVREILDRSRRAGRTVIAGGPLFSDEGEPFPGLEHVVIGEAEELAAELTADLEAGVPKAVYRAPRFPDIALTPAPRWDLLRFRHYASMSVQFSRGCPYDCEFCDIVALNGRVPRLKNPDQLLAELDGLRSLGWDESVFVVDDNFIGDRRRVKELLRAMVAWRAASGSRMTFLTEASINLADDPDLLDLMVSAGFVKVFLGIETPEADSLKACSKVQNVGRDMVEAVRVIQAAGLEVMGGFIIGFDQDKPDIFERQFEFIQKAGVVTAMVGLLQALPRSRLYGRLKREGRLLSESLGDNTRAAFNFEPRLDREFLTANYCKLMRRLYEPRAYYARIRSFLDQHRSRMPARRLTLGEVRALLRSFWLMGVVHRGRRAYWRFLCTTLVRRPAQFGLAMTLAVYGHHFRQVARTL